MQIIVKVVAADKAETGLLNMTIPRTQWSASSREHNRVQREDSVDAALRYSDRYQKVPSSLYCTKGQCAAGQACDWAEPFFLATVGSSLLAVAFDLVVFSVRSRIPSRSAVDTSSAMEVAFSFHITLCR